MLVGGRVGVLFGGFGQKIEGDSWFTWWFNHLIIYQGHLFPLKPEKNGQAKPSARQCLPSIAADAAEVGA